MTSPNKIISKNRSTGTIDKLIRAAVDLLSSRGFKATTVRDIAKAMDMSMAGIYNYFPSKESLFFFIFDKTIREAKEKVFAAAQADLPPMERFRFILTTHFTCIGAHIKESKVTFLEDEHFSPKNKNKSKQYQRAFFHLYVEEIKKLQAEGYISRQPPAILALNIFGVLNWFMRWYHPEGKLSLEQTIEHIVTFIINGVKGP